MVQSVLSVLPILVALIYHEPFQPFIMGVVIPFIAGILLIRFPRKQLDFGDAMLLSSLTLLLLSLFGAFPFFNVLEGPFHEVFVDGYFESMSSYTTTGLTVLPSEVYTRGFTNYHSLLFKRTISEWVGGLGVLVLFISILAKEGMSSVYLYKMAEGVDRITPTVEHTARIILRIYVFYTLTGALLLTLFSKMNLFHSMCSVMSAIATGGFIGALFNANPGIGLELVGQLIMIIIMLIAATPFTLHHHLLSGRLRKFFENIEIRALFIILIISVSLFVSMLWLDGYEITPGIVFQTVLSTVSTVTTTGYTGGNIAGLAMHEIGNAQGLLIAILMLAGACAGSTAGGIKLIRVSVMINAVKWSVRRYILPQSAVVPLKAGGKVWSDRDLDVIAVFFFLYMLVIATGFFTLVLHEIDPMQSLLLSTSSLGNNGLTGMELIQRSIAVKVVLTIQMMAGRLEIFPLLALIVYLVKRFEKPPREPKEEVAKQAKFIRRMLDIK